MTMIKGKQAYLRKLTDNIKIQSVDVDRELDGSSPPSVFIGSWNYPKVYAGPMIAPMHGDTTIMDDPESWISGERTQEEIIGYRLNLVRGKLPLKITDLESSFVEKLQDITLSASSIESEAEFKSKPKGMSFGDTHAPFGPSASIEKFNIDSQKWDHGLEKVYYDTDLKAADAVMDLHAKGLSFSRIQKAFSVGTMGTKRRRRLVPTRWSITACDSIIGNRLLEDVRNFDLIDSFRVHEFASLNNYYAVLLMPTAWQFEWMEAFLRVMGKEELIFSDHELNKGKKGYSSVGGCYYSCKMAALEALAREQRQAGAIILREAYRGYIPLGVFNVRENVRCAMARPPKEFEDVKSAIAYISTKLQLPAKRFVQEGRLLKESISGRQTTIDSF